MNFPHFSRAQLGVILLLGAALLMLYGWRAHWGGHPQEPPATASNPVYVEVAGAAAHPGVYAFSTPPTLSEAWRRAGGPEPPPQNSLKLNSGTKVEILPGSNYGLGRMSGARLLTLGLALDLNTATAQDLEALPGIGPALAKRIVEHRQKHGPFRTPTDLREIPVLGELWARQEPLFFFQEPGAPAPWPSP